MKEFDSVRTLVETEGWQGIVVPAGTVGVITDIHGDGRGLAVDVDINGERNQIYVSVDQVESYDAR